MDGRRENRSGKEGKGKELDARATHRGCPNSKPLREGNGLGWRGEEGSGSDGKELDARATLRGCPNPKPLMEWRGLERMGSEWSGQDRMGRNWMHGQPSEVAQQLEKRDLEII